jgi:hypothetical protein
VAQGQPPAPLPSALHLKRIILSIGTFTISPALTHEPIQYDPSGRRSADGQQRFACLPLAGSAMRAVCCLGLGSRETTGDTYLGSAGAARREPSRGVCDWRRIGGSERADSPRAVFMVDPAATARLSLSNLTLLSLPSRSSAGRTPTSCAT